MLRALLAVVLVTVLTMPPAQAQRRSAPTATLSQSEREVNLFFSNFAEAYLPAFLVGALPDAHLIAFALRHIAINRPRDISGGRVRAAAVDEIAIKYFGRPVGRHRSVPGQPYAGGLYSILQADGEAPRFAHASALRSAGPGEFTTIVSVYSVSDDFEGDLYGTPIDAIRRSSEATLAEQRTARIRRVTESGRSRYIMLEWQ